MTASVAAERDDDFTRVDPRWGEPYGEQVAYVTPQGFAVWMHRKGQRVRFYDARGTQHGAEHRNVAHACYWAAYNAWIDPAYPNLSVACVVEVRGQVDERGGMPLDKGVWTPEPTS